jgi:hypothetical protein
MEAIIKPLSINTINANHFSIDFLNYSIFYSYEKEICVIYKGQIYLNHDLWNFSKTTKTHLYIWLKLDRNELNHFLKNGRAFEYSEVNNKNLPTLHQLINLKSEAI